MKSTVDLKQPVQTEEPVERSVLHSDGALFLDFGRATFGTLLLPGVPGRTSRVVHLGERAEQGRVDRDPPGTVRYCRIEQKADLAQTCRIVIPPDERNTGPAAIRMPEEIGEVFPFRYAEIEDAADLDLTAVRRISVHVPFDDDAASFESSDALLNDVWDLCKHTIKATTFCGVYVDGDRERIPYEADAYINQLGHYCVDSEYTMARYTHEYLLQFPTWPTEWQLHSVLMAWEDILYSGETSSLETFYPLLCAKTMTALAREDGLISTASEHCTGEFERTLNLYHDRYIYDHGLRDLVDWPPGCVAEDGKGERDGHEMMPVNTVVNAFYYRALVLMERMAGLLGRKEDAAGFARRAAQVYETFNRVFWSGDSGRYIDGEGSLHSSQHSNLFALAFGLVPEDRKPGVVEFVVSRGMACSVYGAQFLLEALYLNGAAQAALELMTSRSDRSWCAMLEAGSTMTMEAWGVKYKNNLDWNHAWGAAPANIIPRYLLGVRPLEPGFRRILIQPQPGSLGFAEAAVPTPLGGVFVRYEKTETDVAVVVEIPDGAVAHVDLRACFRDAAGLQVSGGESVYDNIASGRHEFRC